MVDAFTIHKLRKGGRKKMMGIFSSPNLPNEVRGALAEKFSDAEVIIDAEATDFLRQAMLKKSFGLVILTPAGAKAFVVEQVAVSATPIAEKYEIAPQKGD